MWSHLWGGEKKEKAHQWTFNKKACGHPIPHEFEMICSLFVKQKLLFNLHYDYELISHQLFCQCKLIISFSFLSSVTLWQPIKYRKIDLSNIPVPQQKSMKNVILKIYFLYPWYTQNACSGAARGKLFGGQSTCIFTIILPLPVYK